jgi:L-ribulokinase
MGEKKFVIGVDIGTLSGRAVIVDVANGTEIATAVHDYANGVIDDNLPGTEIHLEPDWALQDPNDYIEVFKNSIPTMLVGGFSSESRKAWQEIQRFLQVHFQGIPVP